MTLSHQSMFVHRSIYQRLGFFDLKYKYACDYEYLLRMIKAGVIFEKLDYYGVNFRQGGASTRNMNRSINEVSRIVRKYFGVFSKEYVLFLLTNRMPSMIGNVRRLLSRTIGNQRTVKLRKIWHRMKKRDK
jgi:GT2 family glycosyltransferase